MLIYSTDILKDGRSGTGRRRARKGRVGGGGGGGGGRTEGSRATKLL